MPAVGARPRSPLEEVHHRRGRLPSPASLRRFEVDELFPRERLGLGGRGSQRCRSRRDQLLLPVISQRLFRFGRCGLRPCEYFFHGFSIGREIAALVNDPLRERQHQVVAIVAEDREAFLRKLEVAPKI